jgi:hypothetical protein
MEGIKNKVFPVEMFRNYRLPTPQLAYAGGGYAGGGEVTGRGVTQGSNTPMQPQKQEIKIMNYVDQREMLAALGSGEGEDVILNLISRNKDKVSRVLR